MDDRKQYDKEYQTAEVTDRSYRSGYGPKLQAGYKPTYRPKPIGRSYSSKVRHTGIVWLWRKAVPEKGLLFQYGYT